MGLPSWSGTDSAQPAPPDHQAILLSNTPCPVLATNKLVKQWLFIKGKTRAKRSAISSLRFLQNLLNGCNLVSAIHCQPLGNSLTVSTRLITSDSFRGGHKWQQGKCKEKLGTTSGLKETSFIYPQNKAQSEVP